MTNQGEEADGAGSKNNSDENDAPPRPVFVLGSKFKAVKIGDAAEVMEESKKKPFTFSFNAASAKPENDKTIAADVVVKRSVPVAVTVMEQKD